MEFVSAPLLIYVRRLRQAWQSVAVLVAVIASKDGASQAVLHLYNDYEDRKCWDWFCLSGSCSSGWIELIQVSRQAPPHTLKARRYWTFPLRGLLRLRAPARTCWFSAGLKLQGR